MTMPMPDPDQPDISVLRDDERLSDEYYVAAPPAGSMLGPQYQWLELVLNSPVVRNARSAALKQSVIAIYKLLIAQVYDFEENGWPLDDDGYAIPLAGKELARIIGYSQATAAKALRTLVNAGLLERSYRERGRPYNRAPYKYWVCYPEPDEATQLTLPGLDEAGIREQQRYLKTHRRLRAQSVFARRNDDTGLPICTDSTLAAVARGERSITGIRSITGRTPVTIARHLSILADHGLVTYDRDLGQVAPAWGDNFYRTLHQLAQDIKEA